MVPSSPLRASLVVCSPSDWPLYGAEPGDVIVEKGWGATAEQGSTAAGSCGQRTVGGLAQGPAALPGLEQVCGAGRRARVGVGEERAGPGAAAAAAGLRLPSPASPNARRERQGLDRVAGPVAGKSRGITATGSLRGVGGG